MTKGGTRRFRGVNSSPLVEGGLRRPEPLGRDRLDRIGGPRHETLHVVLGGEARQHPVRDGAPVTAADAKFSKIQTFIESNTDATLTGWTSEKLEFDEMADLS